MQKTTSNQTLHFKTLFQEKTLAVDKHKKNMHQTGKHKKKTWENSELNKRPFAHWTISRGGNFDMQILKHQQNPPWKLSPDGSKYKNPKNFSSFTGLAGARDPDRFSDMMILRSGLEKTSQIINRKDCTHQTTPKMTYLPLKLYKNVFKKWRKHTCLFIFPRLFRFWTFFSCVLTQINIHPKAPNFENLNRPEPRAGITGMWLAVSPSGVAWDLWSVFEIEFSGHRTFAKQFVSCLIVVICCLCIFLEMPPQN